MSSRDYLKHTVSATQPPTHGNLGDEWYNPTTNKLYKLVANSGVRVQWSEVGAGAGGGTVSGAIYDSSNAIVDARVQSLTVNVFTTANVTANAFAVRGTGAAGITSSADFSITAGGNLNIAASVINSSNLNVTGVGSGVINSTAGLSINANNNIVLYSSNGAVIVSNAVLRFNAFEANAYVSATIGDTFYSNVNNVLMSYAQVNTDARAWVEIGYRSLPVNNTGAGAYTIQTTDIGKILLHNIDTTARTWTIPGNMGIGTQFTLVNANSAGALTITPTGDHIMLAGSSTINPAASRTLAANALAILYKITANTWYISGSGIT